MSLTSEKTITISLIIAGKKDEADAVKARYQEMMESLVSQYLDVRSFEPPETRVDICSHEKLHLTTEATGLGSGYAFQEGHREYVDTAILDAALGSRDYGYIYEKDHELSEGENEIYKPVGHIADAISLISEITVREALGKLNRGLMLKRSIALTVSELEAIADNMRTVVVDTDFMRSLEENAHSHGPC